MASLYAEVQGPPAAFLTDDDARACATRLRGHLPALNAGRRPIHSVLSEGIYEVAIIEAASCLRSGRKNAFATSNPASAIGAAGEQFATTRTHRNAQTEPTDTDDADRAKTNAEVAEDRDEVAARIAECEAKWEAFRRRKADILPSNKAALFAALAAAGIHTLVVEFDG